jgi:hypothetical protein
MSLTKAERTAHIRRLDQRYADLVKPAPSIEWIEPYAEADRLYAEVKARHAPPTSGDDLIAESDAWLREAERRRRHD